MFDAGVIGLSADHCSLVGLPLDSATTIAGLDLSAGLIIKYERCCEMVYRDPPWDSLCSCTYFDEAILTFELGM